MPKPRTKKAKLITWKHADSVWAALSVISFPAVALSLASLGWQPYAAFLMACVATLAVLFIEAIVRGKSWIFQDGYRHIFEHQETPFRILVVTGGVLLILESLLVFEFLQNPAVDGMILNVLARKQCTTPQAPFAHIVCPMFENKPTINRQEFALTYSLEEAAKKHLIPSAMAGSCIVLPTDKLDLTQSNFTFFAYCQTWQADTCQTTKTGESAMVNAQMNRDAQGFYAPTAWQEDKQSTQYQSLTANKSLLEYIDQQLNRRCISDLKQPVRF